jgi:hypothetical protein
MSGNGCRIILKSVASVSDIVPEVSFDIKNSSKDSFDMDVKVEYTSAHTIFNIIHALNKSEDNLYTISGNNRARACEFSAYISEDYVIKTSNLNTQGDPDSDTTSVRATNLISTPITTQQLNSSAYSHVKVLTNLRPDYAWSVDAISGDLEFAADVTKITGFSGAIADGGSLSELVLQLRGGLNRSTALTATSSADIIKALEVIEYVDRDLLDINYLFAQQVDGIDVDIKIRDIVEARRDLIGFISAPTSVSSLSSNTEKKNAVLNKFSGIASSSFLVFDSTPLYVYNKYQDNYVWIPACGHMAGLCANTDLISEPWFSPAGFNRGQLRGVTKLALNPTQLERDDLYKNRINPIVSFPGQGIVLFGDKTALSKASAFDRINVRKLFNIVERTVARYAKSQLFEINDEFTRNAFRASIEPFLRDVRGRRGISDYRVVCDETNNTPSVIDGNRFVGDIYIKPVKSINYISLNFIATRTGVSFTEIAG